MSSKKIKLASSSETEERKREIQLLINIAEPDPQYQPFILTDEASLLDAVGTEPTEIARRLDTYFDMEMRLDLSLPLWRLVDRIKQLLPQWPGD
ncbi:MAG: hypothetical protein QM330_10380 [Acidobacteriota bacterium]|jgi:hypothetical protein|nr:hypothetical protein [Acidobacteriota bacterium]NLT32866.1 hypothetical protein [Acidobacteriota bacterium]